MRRPVGRRSGGAPARRSAPRATACRANLPPGRSPVPAGQVGSVPRPLVRAAGDSHRRGFGGGSRSNNRAGTCRTRCSRSSPLAMVRRSRRVKQPSERQGKHADRQRCPSAALRRPAIKRKPMRRRSPLVHDDNPAPAPAPPRTAVPRRARRLWSAERPDAARSGGSAARSTGRRRNARRGDKKNVHVARSITRRPSACQASGGTLPLTG